MIIMVSIVYLGIIAVEVPHLIKSALWRELLAFSFLLLLSMAYGFGLMFNLQLPNLVNGLEALFGPVSQYMVQLLS